eukprot:525499_1
MALVMLNHLIDDLSNDKAINAENNNINEMITKMPHEELLSNYELCCIIMEYLNHLTIINFIDCNVNIKSRLQSNDNIKILTVLFRSYLNAWQSRNESNTITDIDLEILRKYYMCDGCGYSIYTLISATNEIKKFDLVDYTDECYDGEPYDIVMDMLPSLTLEYIDRDTFEDVNCIYSVKHEKYEYSVQDDNIHWIDDIKPSTCWKEITEEKFVRFENNDEFKNKLFSSLPVCFQNNKYKDKVQTIIEKMYNLLSIDTVKYVINDWYFHYIFGYKDAINNQAGILSLTIFGDINDKVITERFKASHRESEQFKEDTRTLIALKMWTSIAEP